MAFLPPVSLYIHMPWCVKKCPYCDFNSHEQKKPLPEKDYTEKLWQDFQHHQGLLQQRPIESIFIGGGTPSLIHPKHIACLLENIKQAHTIVHDAEITMEANPGTLEHYDFSELRKTRVNRLSLGIQTFNNQHLKTLGRIHMAEEAHQAIKSARSGGFDNINLDLMYGLPQQNLEQAMQDLEQAIAHRPEHISWYQLTIEPHTAFYYSKPKLPDHDRLWRIQELGLNQLQQAGYEQYEISAFSRQKPCQHNSNYWKFGDYLGLGAGAHSKITQANSKTVTRYWRHKHPKQYLESTSWNTGQRELKPEEFPLEFLMNHLRLLAPICREAYEQATASSWGSLLKIIKENDVHQWFIVDDQRLTLNNHAFLDEVLTWFLP